MTVELLCLYIFLKQLTRLGHAISNRNKDVHLTFFAYRVITGLKEGDENSQTEEMESLDSDKENKLLVENDKVLVLDFTKLN